MNLGLENSSRKSTEERTQSRETGGQGRRVRWVGWGEVVGSTGAGRQTGLVSDYSLNSRY